MSLITISPELINAAVICVAWLLALPVGVALTSSLAVVQINSQDNAGHPRI